MFESKIMKWVDAANENEIDTKQLGSISRISAIEFLVEMVHLWYEGTDKLNSYDLSNRHLLLEKLQFALMYCQMDGNAFCVGRVKIGH